MAIKKQQPRGLRNNNPLNIKIGNTWLGEVTNPTDPTFEQFVSLRYGLRAAFIILRRYIRHYKRTTIRAIISSWAPEVEPLLTAYINNVVKFTGIDPDMHIDYADKETMCKIVAAMAKVECGQAISDDEIHKAYDIA